uniref:SLC26A/SulP transporter domain-containing protein n=1 Tax=Scylla olivacea TaxID=85551 RepID=A0A0P4VUV9_SCYOL
MKTWLMFSCFMLSCFTIFSPQTYRDLCLGLPAANPVVVVVSVVCIIALVVNNEILKPRMRKVSRIPVPMELLVVVAGTAVSDLLHLEERHHVTVVGHVPTG